MKYMNEYGFINDLLRSATYCFHRSIEHDGVKWSANSEYLYLTKNSRALLDSRSRSMRKSWIIDH